METEIMSRSKILIVDDQPANLSILFDCLDSLNATVLLAQTGKRAIELARREEPDIIILDIVMPEMDGYQVCNVLKEQEKIRDIPVIFMSALSDTENILKGFDAGGVDYITKPIHYQEAVARISTHLKLRYMEEERIKMKEKLKEKEKLESLALMAGGIAHNYNNILTGILGYAEFALVELPADSRVRESIQEVIKSGRRAAEITKEIFLYAEGGNFVMGDTDLTVMIKQIEGLLGLSVPETCKLIYDLSYDIPFIYGNSTIISHMLINLIANASDAIGTRNGTITLRTGVRECSEEYLSTCHGCKNLFPGSYVFLQVEDNGCGIKEEIKHRIFEPFFTTRREGRGLGLASVYGIMKIHKGTVMVQSEVGKGTAMMLLFPALK
ncbi:MAG: response regulator [Candidatus Eremiobacterota bacterium]